MPDPRISVVIAAYRPGEGFDRVMRSLDAQTMPQDQFETIVVDDGSPDDTFERLSRLAATRPNMRVERIENSGWPSRPRNLGTTLARGEYVLFMDHDDSLYPDALRRMAEYAAETDADLLSPKESKTSDAWWGMPSLEDGNVPNAVVDGGIDRLLPMVPHKLYRRTFLDEHGIRFPEGRRQLWEDIYVNVEAWRHAKHVAILADTPAYLWWSSRTNNSKTYGPRSEEFWDRLDELFAFIDETLDGPDHAEARKAALLHQYTGRVLTRLSRNLRNSSTSESEMAMRRAGALQQRYIPEEWDEGIGPQPQARAILLRQGRPDLLADLWSADANTAARVVARSARWEAGVLHLELDAQWLDKSGRRIALRRAVDGRVMRDLSPRLLAALPVAVTDFTDTLRDYRVELGIRDRYEHVTWQVPTVGATTWEQFEDGRLAPKLTAHAVIDPSTAALGESLRISVHDLVTNVHWAAASRGCAVRYGGPAQPAVLASGPAVAYRATSGTLSLDLASRLRNPISDGGPAHGHVPGTPRGGLALPLPRVAVNGDRRLPAALRLVPDQGAAGEEYVLPGTLRTTTHGARLEIASFSPVPDGTYELTFAVADGAFLGRRSAKVQGEALTILRHAPSAPAPASVVWKGRIKRLRKRGRSVLREVYRRVRR